MFFAREGEVKKKTRACQHKGQLTGADRFEEEAQNLLAHAGVTLAPFQGKALGGIVDGDRRICHLITQRRQVTHGGMRVDVNLKGRGSCQLYVLVLEVAVDEHESIVQTLELAGDVERHAVLDETSEACGRLLSCLFYTRRKAAKGT